MSSKADDFDVRYRDGRDGRAWGNGANGPEDGHAADGSYAGDDHGVFGGTVDYDLGYDANGWDTQGFRSPASGYLDNHETAYLGDGAARGNGHGASHARTTSTQDVGQANWAPGSTGPWPPDQPEQPGRQPGRRGRRAKPGGPGGPPGGREAQEGHGPRAVRGNGSR